MLAFAIVALGCASSQPPAKTAARPTAPVAKPTPAPDTVSSSIKMGNIQITYAHPGDYLQSLAVTKYWGASVLETRQKNGRSYSVVRFVGGDPIWAIENQSPTEGSLLGHLPGSGRPDALKSITYGHLPDYFDQEAPSYGSPEPLEPNKYYVFSVTRGSGAVSFQAIKVQPDGSIEAYDADPRAGTSFELCCDLPADFISTPSDTENEEPADNPP